jgi:hypothetical protein
VAKKKAAVQESETDPIHHIKIGYADITLVPLSGKEAAQRCIMGLFDAKHHKIEYDTTLAEKEVVDTLMHEILHAINHMFGIKFAGHEDEEIIVNALAHGITTAMRDNPDFFRWMIDTLE